MSREAWNQKIDDVEQYLKERERLRWTSKELEHYQKHGPDGVSYFRIQYKLEMLDRMRTWLKSHNSLPYSYQQMIKNPKEPWG